MAVINSSHLLQVMAMSITSIVGSLLLRLDYGRSPELRVCFSLARGRGDGYAIRHEWLHLQHRSQPCSVLHSPDREHDLLCVE